MAGQVIGTVNVQTGTTQNTTVSSGIPGATGVGLPGATGATGPAGTSVVIVGSIDTASNLDPNYANAISDGFIANDTGHLWVWDGEIWVDVGNITGPTGATGIQGASGSTGTQGASGSGDTGATGIQGASGSRGLTGATGVRGVQGASGADSTIAGATGLAGASGYIGVDGASGIGATGAQGASGADSTIAGATGIQGASGIGATGPQGTVGPTGATGLATLPEYTFNTPSNNTNQVIVDTIDSSVIRSIKYEIQLTHGSQFQVTELRLLIDEPNVYLTEYGAMGDALGQFAAYYSPVVNNYSSPDINTGGISVWAGTNFRVYSQNNVVILALLSIPVGASITVTDNSSNNYTLTLASAFSLTADGIVDCTTTQTRSPTKIISNIAWTGTGLAELRFTPFNTSTSIKYIASIITN